MPRLETVTLAELAATCRFSSRANVTRAFRRAVGVPPVHTGYDRDDPRVTCAAEVGTIGADNGKDG